MYDLIDRQSAVDIAMSYCPDDDGCCSKAFDDIRELLDEIENLPAVNLWIPCSDLTIRFRSSQWRMPLPEPPVGGNVG